MSNTRMLDEEIILGIKKRNRIALAKLLTLCDNEPQRALRILDKLEKRRAHIVGITGSPGVGKSTLVNAILKRNGGRKVGLILVDPSSPFTRGALLGDRVRMQEHATSDNIFIRSFANRGSLGGLSPSVYEACDAFEAFGMDEVYVETVGVGQSEVEVRKVSDSVVVVLSPESGDDVQMMKAGVMEIANFFVINKCDNPRARILFSRLKATIEMGKKEIPVFLTNALTGEGVSELLEALHKHFTDLGEEALKNKRRKRRLEHIKAVITRELDELLAKEDFPLEVPLSKVKSALISKFCAQKGR